MEKAKVIFFTGIIFFILSCPAWADPIPGLISHWKLDETSGGIAYDSVGSNDGTVYNALWTAGYFDGGLDFDGDGDYVDCGNDPSVNFDLNDGGFSIFAWIKMASYEDFGDVRAIVVKGDTTGNQQGYQAYYLEVLWDGKLRAQLDDGPQPCIFANSNNIILLDQWYFVGFTAEKASDGLKIYIDGTLENTGDASDIDDVGNESENLFIGRPEDDHNDWFFDGIIDDVRIYNRALSAAEVSQLYRGELLSLEITGKDEVAEESTNQYKAIAHYEMEDVEVTALVDWVVEPNDFAYIDGSGLLSTEMVVRQPENVTIYAQFSEGDITVEAEKDVSVLAICSSGSALEFDGQNDYVDCGNDPNVNFDLNDGGFSIFAW
ncbi:MAG: LamG domain-containing protein, partial [Planctomycetota bacterium]